MALPATVINPEEVKSTSFRARWSAVQTAVSYNVYIQGYFGNVLHSSYALINTTDTSLSITGCQPNSLLYVYVRALDSDGLEGIASTTAAISTAPAKSDISQQNLTRNSVTIYWTNNGGYGRLYRNNVQLVPTTQNSDSGYYYYTDHNLSPGVTYTYNGTSFRNVTPGCTNEADWSEPLVVNTPADLITPNGVSVLNVTATSAVVSWQPSSGASYYNVRLNGANPQRADSTTMQIGGLIANTAYAVTVSAVNGGGETAQSAAYSFVTGILAPTQSRLYVFDTSVDRSSLTWDKVTGVFRRKP